jgi:heme-degrading monooxygenase HmoA
MIEMADQENPVPIPGDDGAAARGVACNRRSTLPRYDRGVHHYAPTPMKRFLASIALFSGLAIAPSAFAQAATPAGNLSPETVTVVIQIAHAPGSKPDAAAAAMNDMRAMIRKQPGFLSEEFLQNVNPANAPGHVHVIRWASLKYWEGVFASPEFAKLNAAGSKLYTVSASAFKTTK